MNVGGLRFLAVAGSLFLSLIASAQEASPKTLAAYIKEMAWDVGKSGPLIAVFTDRTPTAGRTGLAAYGRKVVQVGDLSAIVPESMVTIDDNLSKAPDFFEGLPRRSKVLYLLGLLDRSQWQKAVGKGIGLSDLSGEQRNVFISLLPKPLTYVTIKNDKNGAPGESQDPKTVDGDALKQVRIRLTRQLTLAPSTKGPRSTFFLMDLGGFRQMPDAVVKVRDDADDRKQGDLYGVQIRQTLENRTKPSDIAYRTPAWNSQVDIDGLKTVSQVLLSASTATGRSILADPLVASLNVRTAGARVRAGDLLESLALSVTGSFRKVGQTYVLTSDLRGRGTQQLRLAMWATSVQQEADKREKEAKLKLASSGALKLIDFDANNPFAPTDAMKGQLLAEEGTNQRKNIGISELPPAIRAQLDEAVSLSRPPKHYEEVGMLSRFLFAFVLPNGESLAPESFELGSTDDFYKPPMDQPRMTLSIKANPPFKLRDPALRSVMLRADNTKSALDALDIAHTYGFKELLLDTNSQEALRACLDKAEPMGVRISLAIRPWMTTSGTRDVDKNLVGTLGSQLKEIRGRFGYPRSEDPLSGDLDNRPYDTLFPMDPAVTVRWRSLAALAQTPGLSRVVVLDTVPPGYFGNQPPGSFFKSLIVLDAASKLGYSVVQREVFLRLFLTDPIDLADENLRVQVDLRSPFFSDAQLSGIFDDVPRRSEGYDLPAEWGKFRAGLNEKAILSLLGMLSEAKVPLLVQTRNSDTGTARRISIQKFDRSLPWRPGAALPSGDGEGVEGSLGILTLPGSVPPEMLEQWIGLRLEYVARMPATAVVIDLSALPPKQWRGFFAKWFVRASI